MAEARVMCIHNPAVPIEWCSLCLRRAASSSTFSIRELRWKGNAVVEILRDGQPFWQTFEEAFRFGCLKAKLILGSIGHIRTFSEAAAPAETFRTPFRQDFAQLSLSVQAQSFASFTRSAGQIVNEPYLKLSCVPERAGGSIGFGVTKAGALLEIEKDLWAWLAKHCV